MYKDEIIETLIDFLNKNINNEGKRESWTCVSLTPHQNTSIYELFDDDERLSIESDDKRFYFTFVLLNNNKLLVINEPEPHSKIERPQFFMGLIPEASRLTILTDKTSIKILNEKGENIHQNIEEYLIHPTKLPEITTFKEVLKPISLEEITERGFKNNSRIRSM